MGSTCTFTVLGIGLPLRVPSGLGVVGGRQEPDMWGEGISDSLCQLPVPKRNCAVCFLGWILWKPAFSDFLFFSLSR